MDAREATTTLLAARAAGSTVCPSEVARALALDRGQPDDWRENMAIVHASIDQMVAEGLIRLSWKGEMLAARAGPYRIRRRSAP